MLEEFKLLRWEIERDRSKLISVAQAQSNIEVQHQRIKISYDAQVSDIQGQLTLLRDQQLDLSKTVQDKVERLSKKQ